jgi:hypothetical protein
MCTTRPAFYGRIGRKFFRDISEEVIVQMNRELVQKVLDEARSEEANLVIWDRRDTFTIEQDTLSDLVLEDDHLQAKMEDGRVTVYVEFDSIYKLVVEKERKARAGVRAGFGAASG